MKIRKKYYIKSLLVVFVLILIGCNSNETEYENTRVEVSENIEEFDKNDVTKKTEKNREGKIDSSTKEYQSESKKPLEKNQNTRDKELVSEETTTETTTNIQVSTKKGATDESNLKNMTEYYQIGDYYNLNFEETRAILADKGFTVTADYKAHDEMVEGNILEQSIEPGKEVRISDNNINFIVSAGKPQFNLDDLTGYSLSGAKDYAKSKEIKLQVEEEYSTIIDAGNVIKQDPFPGSTLYKNDLLTITISLGSDSELEGQ